MLSAWSCTCFDLYHADPAQLLKVAGRDLDDVDDVHGDLPVRDVLIYIYRYSIPRWVSDAVMK